MLPVCWCSQPYACKKQQETYQHTPDDWTRQPSRQGSFDHDLDRTPRAINGNQHAPKDTAYPAGGHDLWTEHEYRCQAADQAPGCCAGTQVGNPGAEWQPVSWSSGTRPVIH
jgi:hypothetical protein